MPLDSGAVTEISPGSGRPDLAESFGRNGPVFGTAPNIGAALCAAREFHGYSLEDLAESTRIRRAYIAALEEMRLDQLPSRPFTVGYVRAVAQALGLDPDEAV